jgi:hypothetical protein
MAMMFMTSLTYVTSVTHMTCVTLCHTVTQKKDFFFTNAKYAIWEIKSMWHTVTL